MWEAVVAFHIRIACCYPPELLRRSISQRTMRSFAVILLPPGCQGYPHIVQVRNQCAFRHSSRSLPWKLSTWPFCIGLPGSICTRAIFRSSAQPSILREQNSDPTSATLRNSGKCRSLHFTAGPNSSQTATPAHSINQQPPSKFGLSNFERPNRHKSFTLWCPEGDLNPHDRLRSADFKSAASADFAIRAVMVKLKLLLS